VLAQQLAHGEHELPDAQQLDQAEEEAFAVGERHG